MVFASFFMLLSQELIQHILKVEAKNDEIYQK
ncbi:Uncharacterised protein [Staphylococcus aureus]|uniref:Uncharacterized protein n=1 Tax=Staphylococcus aureus TaxID=1280 RepID=A0A8G2M9Q7_STAAU|nr:Uncharacterised protein [Staphylococcus aureus]SUK47893.1 Uncharacterised protein [Staphylococcus aureus]SUK55519.1 Uncharacterised protein [Staphylococcus aureus]SUL26689.1 Uncharacterised protein [Staphylococcus aureus]